jgi:hypothetical protein
MKTPHLDIEIKNLENLSLKKELTGLAKDAIEEYTAIKTFIETHSNKENSKRYFLVSYSGINNLGNCIGLDSFTCEGGFLKAKEAVEQIKELQNLQECVITNIMEISEQDFNDWNN